MPGKHGGYRRPKHPAPTSGPGALSRRTDGGPSNPTQGSMVAPGGAYGDRKEMLDLQGSSPMQGGGGSPVAPTPTPLNAPTARPEEPITSGASVGAGLGPEAAGIANDIQGDRAALKPIVYSLEAIANLPGSNPSTRAYVRRLKAEIGE